MRLTFSELTDGLIDSDAKLLIVVAVGADGDASMDLLRGLV